ncbi:hypothetical protein FXO38_11083 [Capsicum annuum]|nr:hypothetical protein FXO38_11083 [Capsicum annuum]
MLELQGLRSMIKSKYSVVKPITYITTDVFFVKRIRSIYQQWLSLNEEMSCITPEHHVSQYISGYKLLANVSWDSVDNIIIPVNVNESFHWILVVFRIRHRCLYVYDSMMGGTVHSKNVLDYVRSLSTMIPMFLVATNFYEKQSDINWYREAAYIDKALSESLDDYGMFVCTFAEYVSHDMFDISSRLFGVVNHRLRYVDEVTPPLTKGRGFDPRYGEDSIRSTATLMVFTTHNLD